VIQAKLRDSSPSTLSTMLPSAALRTGKTGLLRAKGCARSEGLCENGTLRFEIVF
jgi:hypothetical protein